MIPKERMIQYEKINGTVCGAGCYDNSWCGILHVLEKSQGNHGKSKMYD